MASNSVNVPTNPKIKEQDVNAKLQLYGIYSGTSSPKRRVCASPFEHCEETSS
jgi:hypothetical protein